MALVEHSRPRPECRSALYMPASNQRVLDKGPLLPADAIIIDLEDSVAAVQKTAAREQAVAALKSLDYGYRTRALRINAADAQWHDEDIAAAASACPDAIVLPKVDSVEDVHRLSTLMDAYPTLADVQIWAMIESPAAILNARDIGQSAEHYPRLSALLIGNNDLALAGNMPVTSDRTYLVPWLMHLVAVAHACQLTLLDGVFNDFSDVSSFRQECCQAVAMGMHGKTLIHPSQVAVANEIFAPTADEIARARQIVTAFGAAENADVGVLQINGRMVERLHLAMAETLLARATRLAEME